MTIAVGDKLPSATFFVLGDSGPEQLPSDSVFSGKKVVLFGLPGAYTGTCTNTHVPGYMAASSAFKEKGVDTIAVVSVNDPFVMKAWGESTGGAGTIQFLSDGNGEFTKALGLEMDGSGAGLGIRSKRYSMLVDNGEVVLMNVEDVPSVVTVSGADELLSQM